MEGETTHSPEEGVTEKSERIDKSDTETEAIGQTGTSQSYS